MIAALGRTRGRRVAEPSMSCIGPFVENMARIEDRAEQLWLALGRVGRRRVRPEARTAAPRAARRDQRRAMPAISTL
jgi:hypothetical protein